MFLTPGRSNGNDYVDRNRTMEEGVPQLERQNSLREQANEEPFMTEGLSIIVLGASGDLAKKKTYLSLFALYCHDLLPKHVTVCGFARSPKTDQEFRDSITGYLNASSPDHETLKQQFLERCYYRQGAYGSNESFGALAKELEQWEEEQGAGPNVNRLYYFAIPPNVFLENAAAIKVRRSMLVSY